MTRAGSVTEKIGFVSAAASLAFSVTYILAQFLEWGGLLGSAGGPESASTPLGIAILLTPSLLLGSAFVVMMAALHLITHPGRQVFSLTALAFALMYATLTGMVYFVQLTLVAPRIASADTDGIELLFFIPYRSFLFAIDLLGYSFMSLSTLFGAFALPADRSAGFARLSLLLNGLLLPFLALQMFFPNLIYIAALWGITFPCAAFGLALVFRHPPVEWTT